MFPKPKPQLKPNTYAYESEPMVKATGFREYDARWLFGKEINLMGIQALGMGLGALIAELGARQEIVTGHDFRAYSASIKYALVSGLLASGCKVHDIGLAARNILESTGLHKLHLETTLFEQLKNRNPVNSSRLHRHSLDPAGL